MHVYTYVYPCDIDLGSALGQGGGTQANEDFGVEVERRLPGKAENEGRGNMMRPAFSMQ